jgi:hypothetical protein
LNLLYVFFDEKRNPKDGRYQYPDRTEREISDVVCAKLFSASGFAAGSMALSLRKLNRSHVVLCRREKNLTTGYV